MFITPFQQGAKQPGMTGQATGTLRIKWCSSPVIYKLTNDSSAIIVNRNRCEGTSLNKEETAKKRVTKM